MQNKLWIFPTILCLLVAVSFLEGFSVVGFLLCILWFIRILCLKKRSITFLSLIVGLVFTGVIQYHQKTNISAWQGEETSFIVYPQATSVKVDGDRVRFDGVIQTEAAEEKVVIQYDLESEAEKEQWEENQAPTHLRIEGTLATPATHSNFHQFNYQQYLKRNNIHWQLEAEHIEKLPHQALSLPRFHRIEKIRVALFNYIDQTFNDKIASYLKILFFADERDFTEEALQSYRALGVVHLFSISGFHITYLINLVRLFLLRMGVTHERTHLFLLLFLPFYGQLAGFGVSVFRAVFQNAFKLLSKLLHQPLDTLDAWALTFLLALFVNPYQIYQIAFQLSYTLSGIFILMGKKKWMQELNVLAYTLLFSLMSGLASLPILTYHFFEIPWITVFANVLFIPFFTYVLFPALLIVFSFSRLFASTRLFNFLVGALTQLILMLENFLSSLHTTYNFSLVTGRLPQFVFVVLILSIFIFLKRVEAKKRPSFLVSVSIMICLFYYQWTPVGYVTMLDVGQGDSILIKEPYKNKITLIDTGGSVQWGEREPWQEREQPFSIGADIVSPSLKALGVASIDRLYLTHADTDHMGEVASIGEELEIKEIAATPPTLKDPAVLHQLKEIPQTKLQALTAPAVVDYPVEGTVVLHPITPNSSENDQSLTLYVKMGGDTWLFTGDIEEKAEHEIIKQYPNLTTNYLKVAHHGSQTSSTTAFIEQVQPEKALISAGKNNIYGHPATEVLDRLDEMKTQVYTTSEEGAVMVRYLKIPGGEHWLTDLQTVHKN